jgi:regulator of sigma E protease
MSIIIFFAVLFVLILVHEWGHFIVAKKTGMRVDEFGIGFPPKLWGIKKGETEYTLNALPIGGFVRIYGENAADADSDSKDGLDIDGSFTSKSKWAQAAVLVAGVTMNALFAWFLFALVFALGVPTQVEEGVATESAQLLVSAVLPDGPAAEAGIPAGSVIVGVSAGEDRDRVLHPSTFSAFMEDHEGTAIDLQYMLDDVVTETQITPSSGIIESDMDKPAIGVALALVETVRSPIHVALYDGFIATVTGLRDITVGLASLLYDSVRGKADFSQVAGPVGIVGLVGDAAEFGFTSLLMFTAFISLNLAVINMLPFPALDGGRLLFVGIEAIRRKPINPVWVGRLNGVGFLLLMLLMVIVTYNDIARIL